MIVTKPVTLELSVGGGIVAALAWNSNTTANEKRQTPDLGHLPFEPITKN